MAQATITDPLLSVERLTLAFGEKVVLQDLDLKVADGERVVILGRSGAGKSSLLRCIAALEQADGGSLSLGGVPYIQDGRMTRPPYEVRRRIGMVFQGFHLFPNMTVCANITLAMRRVRGIAAPIAGEIAQKVANSLEVGSLLDRYPGTLSGGQTQRVALCRALVLEPTVLLLDEITSRIGSGNNAKHGCCNRSSLETRKLASNRREPSIRDRDSDAQSSLCQVICRSDTFPGRWPYCRGPCHSRL